MIHDADTVAGLPASVYTLRSVEETEALLENAGFEAIHTRAAPVSGHADFVCTEARRTAARR